MHFSPWILSQIAIVLDSCKVAIRNNIGRVIKSHPCRIGIQPIADTEFRVLLKECNPDKRALPMIVSAT